MKKMSKFLIGVQTVILMSAVALPAQAALLIGGPETLPGSGSGSVVSLHSSTVPMTTRTTSASGSTSTPTPTSTSTPTSTPTPSQGTWVEVSSPTTTQPNVGSTSTQGTWTTVTVPNTTAAQSPSVSAGQSTLGGSVVSLSGIYNQSTTSTPTTTPTTTSTTTSSNTSTTSPSVPAIPLVTSLTPDEQQMIDMINQERIAAGVAPLKVDLRLVSVGEAKANDMKANNYFSHTSPTYGSPWAMMQQVGLTVGWAGENIAGNDSVSGAMSALMGDPAHKANILDPRFTDVGVGIAYGSAYGNLYVQEFLQE